MRATAMYKEMPAQLKLTESSSLLNMDEIASTPPRIRPFPYLVAHDIVAHEAMSDLRQDFPEIKRHGFFPLSTMTRTGAFHRLLTELEAPEFSQVIGEKLGIDLSDKPRLITVRRWSKAKDGYIHNDSLSKIVTALLYLNETWPHGEGGCFRILRNDHDFDAVVESVTPLYGTLVAFRRSENSWHGHKPVAGERRVIQVTWLRSQADLERKTNRGRRAFFLKKLFSRPSMMD
jgi:hypothetical protein